MKNYRKKPVVIEAAQWDGTAEGAGPIIDWILTGDDRASYVEDDVPHYLRTNDEWVEGTDVVKPGSPGFIVINTLEGPMRLNPQDWAIKGVKGEFYPVKPDIFAATYDEEPAE